MDTVRWDNNSCAQEPWASYDRMRSSEYTTSPAASIQPQRHTGAYAGEDRCNIVLPQLGTTISNHKDGAFCGWTTMGTQQYQKSLVMYKQRKSQWRQSSWWDTELYKVQKLKYRNFMTGYDNFKKTAMVSHKDIEHALSHTSPTHWKCTILINFTIRNLRHSS